MSKVLDRPSHSLREFRILPGYTPPDGNALNVDLTTRCAAAAAITCACTRPS